MTLLRCCLALLLPCAALAAQDVYPLQPVLQDGDVVVGVGGVTSIDNVAVNESGQWILEVDTDNADTNVDGALVKDGSLLLQEGQALGLPVGASIDSFDTVNLDIGGHSGWNFFLAGTGGTTNDSGVYWDTTLLIQEGQLATALGFSAGTPYIGFFECKLSDTGTVLVMASVDDPLIASTVDRALVKLSVDPFGTLLGETLVFKEGDVLPGQSQPVTDWDTGPHGFALNDAGQVLHNADLAGDTAFNQALYLDGTLLAQKGFGSPVAGRNWLSLSSSKVDLTDAGEFVYTGSLDGDAATNTVIIRGTSVVAQEGDSPSDIGAFQLTGFGSGPVELGANGNVLWFGDWDDPDTTRDTGLFLNSRLIVQEGVTQIGGVTILSLTGVQDGYALSDDGRYVLIEARLTGSIDGAFLIDTGPWVNLGASLAGDFEPALLGAGLLEDGTDVALHLTEAPPASPFMLAIGLAAINAPFKGGTFVPDPLLLVFLATDGDGALSVSSTWPPGIPAGTQLHAQAWLEHPSGPLGFLASNAVRGTSP
jgi:hypothetical protein